METNVRREAEYQAMRATIRQRGTARMVLVPLVLAAWAAIAVTTSAVMIDAVTTLVPLLVLAAGFEATFALHMNVERIGRYLQVFHERPGDGAGWEHVTMEFGKRFPGGGTDPLFGRLFITAISVNFLPVAIGGVPAEIAVLAILHFVLIYRIRMAQNAARAQRAEDLERFEQLLRDVAANTQP